MKIKHKSILSNLFNLAIIVVVGFFAFQNLDLVLTKLRFVEIADDLNASFLEMRLSEKNFFLYKDGSALLAIKDKIDETQRSIDAERGDIIRAVGEKNLAVLESDLKGYAGAVEGARTGGSPGTATEEGLRARGKRLKEFSEEITRLERARVNEIISHSKRMLFYMLCTAFLLAIAVSQFASSKLLKSLRKIENAAKATSAGRFIKIPGVASKDELGAVVTAFNSMSEELRSREEEIIQAKKLASIGTLTAGVAHELTNPLNNISMIAQTYEELYDKLSREQRIEFMEKVEGDRADKDHNKKPPGLL